MQRALAVPFLLVSLGSVPSASAAPPAPEDFEIRHFIRAPDGAPGRAMTEADRLHFYNQARCECGQSVGTQIRLVVSDDPPDAQTMITALLGTECVRAELDPSGPFGRCGELVSAPIASFVSGVEFDVHPLFLAEGIEPDSSRGISDPNTILRHGCGPFQGEGGVSLCAENNGALGCQADEFFVTALGPDQPPGIRFDFIRPVTAVSSLNADPADGGVTLTWESLSGDINGYRVLCEVADTGAPVPDRGIDPPDITAIPDGTHYFTSHDLCGGEPFSSVNFVDDGPDGSECGDGRLGPGEACDDGEDNRDGGLCSPTCQLGVSEGLHALEWDYLCSAHLNLNERSVVIDGLANGTTYNFVLVAYDHAGNPRAVASVARATPGDQFEPLPGAEQGCGCRGAPDGSTPALLLLGLGLLRRRRSVTRPRTR